MSVSRERHWFERTANDVAVQRGFQLRAGAEVVRPKHLFDAAVEPLDHAVGLGVLRRGQAVFDAKVRAQLVERVLATGRAPAQAEQTVSELAQRAIEGAIGSSPMASASRSSIDTKSVFRSTIATASCAGVNLVCSRWGVGLRSCTLSRCFHL